MATFCFAMKKASFEGSLIFERVFFVLVFAEWAGFYCFGWLGFLGD
jgi:hypothetical protein